MYMSMQSHTSLSSKYDDKSNQSMQKKSVIGEKPRRLSLDTNILATTQSVRNRRTTRRNSISATINEDISIKNEYSSVALTETASNDQYIEHDNSIYPDTMTKYLEGLKEGIKYDLTDLWKQSIRFFFPSYDKNVTSQEATEGNQFETAHDSGALDEMETDNPTDSISNYEIDDSMMTDEQSTEVSNDIPTRSCRPGVSISKQDQAKAMLQMRCPSTWTDRSTSSINPSFHPSFSLSKRSIGAGSSLKDSDGKPKRVSLSKLYNSKDISYYDCLNEGILILGSKKLIYVVNDHESEGTAALLWCIMYHELSSCMLSFQHNAAVPYVTLELGLTSGASYAASMADTLICVKILQSIQEKRAKVYDKSIQNDDKSNADIQNILSPQPVTKSIPTNPENDFLSPNSTARVKTLARQLQFGVSELGLKMKLENEGFNDSKSEILIRKAKNIVSSKCEVSPKKRPLQTNLKDSVSESSSPKKMNKITQEKSNYIFDDSLNYDNFQMNDSEFVSMADIRKKDSEINSFRKYELLANHGVSVSAIQVKMIADNVPIADQKKVIEKISYSTDKQSKSSAESPPQQTATVTDKDQSQGPGDSKSIPSHLDKFVNMIKHGVPAPAVMVKMNQEKIPIDEQELVIQDKILFHELTTTNPKMNNMKKSFKLPTIQENKLKLFDENSKEISKENSNPNKLNDLKLVNLHWEPVSKIGSEDENGLSGKAENIWKRLESRRSSFGEASSSAPSLQDQELESLVNMFSRKKTVKVNKCTDIATESMGSATVSDKLSRRISAKHEVASKVVDSSRNMSVSIVLTSLKSRGLDADKVCEIIQQIDASRLCLEDALRIKETLPSDTEVKGFKDLFRPKGSLKNKSAETATETEFDISTLNQVEQYLYKLSQVNQFRERLSSIVFLLSYDASISGIQEKCNKITNMIDKVIVSEGLAEIMQAILAVGNAMNGNNAGSVVGFKLNSLTKLNQTKSADGKSTVLDYIVQILHTRQQAGDRASSIAFKVDEELSTVVVPCKQLYLSDISKDFTIIENEFKKYLRLLESDQKVSGSISQRIQSMLEATKEIVNRAKEKVFEFELFFDEITIPSDGNANTTGEGCVLIVSYLDSFFNAMNISKQKFLTNLKKMQRESSSKLSRPTSFQAKSTM